MMGFRYATRVNPNPPQDCASSHLVENLKDYKKVFLQMSNLNVSIV